MLMRLRPKQTASTLSTSCSERQREWQGSRRWTLPPVQLIQTSFHKYTRPWCSSNTRYRQFLIRGATPRGRFENPILSECLVGLLQFPFRGNLVYWCHARVHTERGGFDPRI